MNFYYCRWLCNKYVWFNNATNSNSSLIVAGDSANIFNFEQYLGNTAYSATIAGVVAKALSVGSGYFNSTNGTCYAHDPGAAWVAYHTGYGFA